MSLIGLVGFVLAIIIAVVLLALLIVGICYRWCLANCKKKFLPVFSLEIIEEKKDLK